MPSAVATSLSDSVNETQLASSSCSPRRRGRRSVVDASLLSNFAAPAVARCRVTRDDLVAEVLCQLHVRWLGPSELRHRSSDLPGEGISSYTRSS
jgi:hypothetical protein